MAIGGFRGSLPRASMVSAAGRMPGRSPLDAGPGIGVGVIQIRIDPAFPMPFLHAHHLAHHRGLMLFGRYVGTAARLTAGAGRRRCLITHGHALHTGWAPGTSPAATIIWPGSLARTRNRGGGSEGVDPAVKALCRPGQ